MYRGLKSMYLFMFIYQGVYDSVVVTVLPCWTVKREVGVQIPNRAESWFISAPPACALT